MYYESEPTNYDVKKISFVEDFQDLTETVIATNSDGPTPTFSATIYRPDLRFEMPLMTQVFGGTNIKLLGRWKKKEGLPMSRL